LIRIVSATKLDRTTFERESLLGRSVEFLFDKQNVAVHVEFNNANKKGLSEIYNEAIAAFDGQDILVFVHDDVWVHELFLTERLVAALSQHEVVGVAGSIARVPSQEAWWHGQARSGVVWHSRSSVPAQPNNYGPTPSAVRLLDGVFLAARLSTLTSKNIRFDEQFRFHFYDLDFCRTCEIQGVTMGTWPIALIHGGQGNLNQEWHDSRRAYLGKWKT
jgi:GT2 family glycosyltransferase